MLPLTHLVPDATGVKTTWLIWSHMPIIVPSGEQTSTPGVEQLEPLVDGAPVDGEPVAGTEGAAGAAEGCESDTGGATALGEAAAGADELGPPVGWRKLPAEAVAVIKVVATGEAELAGVEGAPPAGAEGEGLPEPAFVMPPSAGQAAGAARRSAGLPAICTLLPGLGNLTLCDS